MNKTPYGYRRLNPNEEIDTDIDEILIDPHGYQPVPEGFWGKHVVVGQHITRPIDPGEGYRLLGWEESAHAHTIEIFDGNGWRPLPPPIPSHLMSPKDLVPFRNGRWLAARVPVEQGYAVRDKSEENHGAYNEGWQPEKPHNSSDEERKWFIKGFDAGREESEKQADGKSSARAAIKQSERRLRELDEARDEALEEADRSERVRQEYEKAVSLKSEIVEQSKNRIRDEALEEAANVVASDIETTRDHRHLSQNGKSLLLFGLRCVEYKIRKLKKGDQ